MPVVHMPSMEFSSCVNLDCKTRAALQEHFLVQPLYLS